MSADTAAARALTHSMRPALVFASPPDRDAPGVVDLRALDTPVSDVALRNALLVAWRAAPTLTVRVDGAPSARVLALLHGAVHGEIRLGAGLVERFQEGHRVIAVTDAEAPSGELLALFKVRVRATRSSHAR